MWIQVEVSEISVIALKIALLRVCLVGFYSREFLLAFPASCQYRRISFVSIS